jgi:23S rRNA pseudouridine1911/1915/1917 synthase
MATIVTLTVPADGDGQRLDRWLASQLPDRSRTEIQRWIAEGRVQFEGAAAKASLRLMPGMAVAVDIPEVAPAAGPAAEPIPLTILYEDADLLVVDKPAGMVVHPAPGHSGGTLVNAVLHHCPDIAGVGGERRPGIVHRLDQDTSGLIVVAKHDRAHRHLQAQFKRRTVYKEYIALVDGQVTPRQGTLSAPIGRHPTDRKRQAVLPAGPDGGGREAITEYRVAAYYSAAVAGNTARANFSLLQVTLHTGRTHQIRVHCAWIGHPVVGDRVYGLRRPRLPLARQFLHSHRLRFRLPSSEEEVEFVAPLPADLAAVVARLEQEK